MPPKEERLNYMKATEVNGSTFISFLKKKLLLRMNYVLLNISKSLQKSSIRIVVPNYPCRGLKKDTYYPVK